MIKRLNTWVLAVILLFFTLGRVDGYTVDDVRDLLGKDRIDGTFTSSQIALIVEQYEKIERANLYLKLLEIGRNFNPNKENYEKYQELQQDLTVAKTKLANSFQGGEDIRTVMQDKSSLESVLYRIEGLKDVGYSIAVEYIPNTWEEQYHRVQEMVYDMQGDYEIGDVGQDMRLPINYSFILMSPFGFRLNEETKDSVYMHNGLDFMVTEDTIVYAQWNGVVSSIYESNTEGLTVEISHGKDLKTVYSNLKDVRVKVGSRVNQYNIIALTKSNYLHFGVFLDNEYVNPIYLFGTKGLQAFQTFVSDNPEQYLDAVELEKVIKDAPNKDSEIREEKPSGLIMDLGQESSSFNRQTFYENRELENNEKGLSPEEEIRLRRQMLKEILNS